MDKFVKPVNEAFVRCPATMAVVPKEGMTVPWTGPLGRYWRRRVKHGEVEIAEVPKKAKSAASSASTPSSTGRNTKSNTTEEVTTDGN